MALYEFSDQQKKFMEQLLNVYEVRGNREQRKMFDTEVDSIFLSLNNPVKHSAKPEKTAQEIQSANDFLEKSKNIVQKV